jgi:recombinational DNA repair protein RecT
MSMRCKVNNRITPQKVHNTTLEEEVMEDEEDMKEEVDIEVEEEVKEPLVEEEDRSSIITVDNNVTSPETVPWLHVPTVKLPTMLSKTVQYYWQRSRRNNRVRTSSSME